MNVVPTCVDASLVSAKQVARVVETLSGFCLLRVVSSAGSDWHYLKSMQVCCMQSWDVSCQVWSM